VLLKAKLKRLLKKILLIRLCENIIIKEYPKDQIKTPMHMSKGEELIVSSLVTILGEKNDYFGYYRSHSLYLSVTENFKAFFGEMYGKKIGQNQGLTGSMHIFTPKKSVKLMSAIVSGTIAPSLGNAYGNLINKKKTHTICFFGDGATEEGVFWETLNFASKKKIPILFVCLNNQLAVDLPINERQSYNLSNISKIFDIKNFTIHSANVERVLKKCLEIKNFLITKKKPVFLHFKYYRFLQHLGIDKDSAFKNNNSKSLNKLDPYILIKKYILKKRYFNKNQIDKIENNILNQINKDLKFIKKSNTPNLLKNYKPFYE